VSLTAGLGAPCFQALTRPVSMMGLPLTYVVLLAMAVMGGFIATLSFAWLAASAVLGYAALRALAAWDPRIFDVIFTSLRRTPLPAAWLRGRGIVYRA
jgi:type IV secretion system protein VirB3